MIYIAKAYKYCPVCGGKLKIKDYKPKVLSYAHKLLVCQNCNYHLYLNTKPCNAGILVNPKGEIVLIKRKWPPKKGLLDLPGGFIDPKESAEDSLRREVREELGIKLDDVNYLGSYSDTYEFQGINYDTLGFVFVSNIPDEPLQDLDDVGEVKFFKPEDIPFKKLAFKSVKQALRVYLASK